MVWDDLMIYKYTVVYFNINRSRPVTLLLIHTIIGAPVDRHRLTNIISPDHTLPSVRIIVPSSRMASSPLTIILQLISEQYMIELHSPPGRYTIFRYLADYVNTLSPIWYTLDNNTNLSGFSHIYTRKVLLPHIKHHHRDSIYFSLCN